MLAAAGQHLDQPIEIFLAFVERLHPNPFVLAVDPAAVVDVTREPGVALGRNARVSQKASIRGTRAHDWKHDGAGPKLLR